MAFKLRKSDDFEFPVEVEEPTASGLEKSGFVGRFKRMTADKVSQIFRGNGLGEVSDREIAEQVLIGWGEDLVDDEGKPLPFNKATKKLLLDRPEVTRGVVFAFGSAMTGRQYVAKN